MGFNLDEPIIYMNEINFDCIDAFGPLWTLGGPVEVVPPDNLVVA
jgi:hypothetical protein